MLAGVLLRFVIGRRRRHQQRSAVVLVDRSAVPRAAPGAALRCRADHCCGRPRWAWLAGRLSGVSASASRMSSSGMPAFDPAATDRPGRAAVPGHHAVTEPAGFAVLRSTGYTAGAADPCRHWAGLTVDGAARRTHQHLAAITASICTGPDTHPILPSAGRSAHSTPRAYLLCAIFGASLVAVSAACRQH